MLSAAPQVVRAPPHAAPTTRARTAARSRSIVALSFPPASPTVHNPALSPMPTPFNGWTVVQ